MSFKKDENKNNENIEENKSKIITNIESQNDVKVINLNTDQNLDDNILNNITQNNLKDIKKNVNTNKIKLNIEEENNKDNKLNKNAQEKFTLNEKKEKTFKVDIIEDTNENKDTKTNKKPKKNKEKAQEKPNRKEKYPSTKEMRKVEMFDKYGFGDKNKETEEIYDSDEDEEYLEQTLGIKKVNPTIEGFDEIKNENIKDDILKRKDTPITLETNLMKSNIRRDKDRSSSTKMDTSMLRFNNLCPIIEDNDEDIQSSSSVTSNLSDDDRIGDLMEKNLNSEKGKYNKDNKDEKTEKKRKRQKKSSFSQSELHKKEMQEIIYFEKKNYLKKNEVKTIPLRKQQRVEFSPKLTAITEIQSPQKSIPDYKYEEEDIDFNLDGKKRQSKEKNVLLKSYKSSRELQTGINGFELIDRKGHKFYRVMTINPEKEVELAFFLEKTDGMPKGIYYICGSVPNLGEWDTKRSLKMKIVKRNHKKFYFNSIILKKNNFPVQYKYFVKSNHEIIWIGKAFDNYIASEEIFTFISEMRFKNNSILSFNTFSVAEKINYDNSWENRKDFVISFIFKAGSDVIFFQDINKTKYHFIHHRIDAIYEFIGVDRDEVEDTQQNLIAYNKHKYTLNDWGTFWLSSTPGVPGSNDYNNSYPRNCIWASLKKFDDYSCLYFNVELDRNNYKNNGTIINIILQQIKKVMSKHKDENFIFLGGSFYVESDDPIIQSILKFGFKKIHFETNYHGLSGFENKEYDYLFYIDKVNQFVVNHSITFKEETIINRSKNSYISDHYPIKIEYMNNYMKKYADQ